MLSSVEIHTTADTSGNLTRNLFISLTTLVTILDTLVRIPGLDTGIPANLEMDHDTLRQHEPARRLPATDYGILYILS